MIYSSQDNTGLVRVLKFLQAHNTEYLSGQDLSDVLRISRVAVWKHIKKIRELGYTVESKQKRGYRLLTNSEMLLPWEITANLQTDTIGQTAYYFESVDSTQDQALKMAEDSTNNGAVIVAAKQTRGRGRNKRRWISPKGGIWISVILQPKFDVPMATLFPMASSLALSLAIEKTCRIKPELKWPNDLTINGKKIAGMLVDALLESNRINRLVLGVGINFNVNVQQIEELLKETPNFYGVASLDGQKNSVKPVEIVQAFLMELEKIYKLLCAKQTKKTISEWTARSSTIGREVELDTDASEKKIKGRALKIDEDGALVITKNNKTYKVIAGDIVHVPE